MNVVEASVCTSEVLGRMAVDASGEHHCRAVAAGRDHSTAHRAAAGGVIWGATTPPPRNKIHQTKKRQFS